MPVGVGNGMPWIDQWRPGPRKGLVAGKGRGSTAPAMLYCCVGSCVDAAQKRLSRTLQACEAIAEGVSVHSTNLLCIHIWLLQQPLHVCYPCHVPMKQAHLHTERKMCKTNTGPLTQRHVISFADQLAHLRQWSVTSMFVSAC